MRQEVCSLNNKKAGKERDVAIKHDAMWINKEYMPTSICLKEIYLKERQKTGGLVFHW